MTEYKYREQKNKNIVKWRKVILMLVHMLRLFEKTRRIDENTLVPSTTQRKRKNKKRKEEMKTQIKEKDKDVICDILMQENTDRKNATGKMKHKLF